MVVGVVEDLQVLLGEETDDQIIIVERYLVVLVKTRVIRECIVVSSIYKRSVIRKKYTADYVTTLTAQVEHDRDSVACNVLVVDDIHHDRDLPASELSHRCPVDICVSTSKHRIVEGMLLTHQSCRRRRN